MTKWLSFLDRDRRRSQGCSDEERKDLVWVEVELGDLFDGSSARQHPEKVEVVETGSTKTARQS